MPSPVDSAPPTPDLAALNAQHVAHYAAGDFDALAGLYAEDAQLLVAHHAPLTGRMAIRKAYVWMRQHVAALELHTGMVQLHDGAAVETGRYRHLDAHGRRVDEGHYLVVWQRRRGGWQIRHDMLCTALPLPPDTPGAPA